MKGKKIVTRADICALVLKGLALGKIQKEESLAGQLLPHYKYWYEDCEGEANQLQGDSSVSASISEGLQLAKRKDELNKLCDEILVYLSSLAETDESKLSVFRADEGGFLRQNLLKYPFDKNMVRYMQEMIRYVTILGELSANERNQKLESFPASLKEEEYNCLEGCRDRLQPVLFSLTQNEISVKEQRFLNAHNELVEEHRKKYDCFIIENNQSHLPSAINYLCGVEDNSRSQAKPNALSIPMDDAWRIFRNYVADYNRVFKSLYEHELQAEIEAEIEYVESIIFQKKFCDEQGFMQFKNYEEVSEILGKRGISAGSLAIAYDEACTQYKWSKDLVREVVESLERYSVPEIDDSLPLSEFPESLFSAEIPQKIALFINSGDALQQDLAIRILLMLGHEGQVGNSPVQFLNSINEIGKNCRTYLGEEVGLSDFSRGVQRIEDFNSADIPMVRDRAMVILGRISQYQNSSTKNDDMKDYIAYLESDDPKDIPTVNQLVLGNAGLDLIRSSAQNKKQDYMSGLRLYRMVHNPRVTEIMIYVISQLDRYKIDYEDFVEDIGIILVNSGSIYNIPDLIETVRTGALIENKDNCDYAVFAHMILQGLAADNALGLRNLVKYNLKYCVRLIQNLPINVADDILFSPKIFGQNIFDYLLSEKDLVTLKNIFTLLPAEWIRQRMLVNTYRFVSFHNIVKLGDYRVLEMFLSLEDKDGKTIIHPDYRDQSGSLALIYAASGGNVDCLKLLLEKGANPFLRNRSSSETAFYRAVENGHDDIVATLLSHCKDDVEKLLRGAVVVRENNNTYKYTHLLIAIKNGHYNCFDMLLEYYNSHQNDLFPAQFVIDGALRIAATYNHVYVLNRLLSLSNEQGNMLIDDIDREITSESYNTLMCAVENGNENCVRTLLEHGANPAISSQFGNITALHLAASSGCKSIVEMLLSCQNNAGERLVDINAVDSAGYTPLMGAVIFGHVEVFKELLREGADPQKVIYDEGYKGFSALHFAIYHKQVEIVRELVSMCDQAGNFIFDFAPKNGAPSLFNLALDSENQAVMQALLESGRCYDLSLPFSHYVAAKLSSNSGIYAEVKKYTKLQEVANSLCKDVVSKLWATCEHADAFSYLDKESDLFLNKNLAQDIYNRLAILYKGDIRAFKQDLKIDAARIEQDLNRSSLNPLAEKLFQLCQLERTSSRAKHCNAKQDKISNLFSSRDNIRNLNCDYQLSEHKEVVAQDREGSKNKVDDILSQEPHWLSEIKPQKSNESSVGNDFF